MTPGALLGPRCNHDLGMVPKLPLLRYEQHGSSDRAAREASVPMSACAGKNNAEVAGSNVSRLVESAIGLGRRHMQSDEEGELNTMIRFLDRLYVNVGVDFDQVKQDWR
eukprot:4931332-Karenia_brevis.AAC.1